MLTNLMLTFKTQSVMNIQSINLDIDRLEKALSIIEKTENYLHFKKSALILDICEQINVLKEKRDRQADYLIKLQNIN